LAARATTLRLAAVGPNQAPTTFSYSAAGCGSLLGIGGLLRQLWDNEDRERTLTQGCMTQEIGDSGG
jgi:hypothetical protein